MQRNQIARVTGASSSRHLHAIACQLVRENVLEEYEVWGSNIMYKGYRVRFPVYLSQKPPTEMKQRV